MGGTGPLFIHSYFPEWSNTLGIAGLVLSMTVNALVTGLIVFKLFKVFQEVKTAHSRILGVTSGSVLRHVMFILIESGMALFSIQLVRLVVSIVSTDEAAYSVYYLITGIHVMINVIITSVIARPFY